MKVVNSPPVCWLNVARDTTANLVVASSRYTIERNYTNRQEYSISTCMLVLTSYTACMSLPHFLVNQQTFLFIALEQCCGVRDTNPLSLPAINAGEEAQSLEGGLAFLCMGIVIFWDSLSGVCLGTHVSAFPLLVHGFRQYTNNKRQAWFQLFQINSGAVPAIPEA